MNRLKQIIEFAIEKHDGQVDKGGNSYIFHPIAVAAGCGTESEKVVAFLHDVLEDTNASIEDLIALGVTDDELVAIQLLTKPDKEDYMHYIKRIAQNPLAKAVKIADLRDNMDLSRIPKITEKDIERTKKYQKALEILLQRNK